MRQFYRDVFDLTGEPKSATAPLLFKPTGGDARVLPWSIPVSRACRSSARVRTISLHVENLDAFKARVAEVAGMNPYLAGRAARWQPGIRCAQTLFAVRRGQMADVRSRRELDRHHDDDYGVILPHSMWTPSMSSGKAATGIFGTLEARFPSEP